MIQTLLLMLSFVCFLMAGFNNQNQLMWNRLMSSGLAAFVAASLFVR